MIEVWYDAEADFFEVVFEVKEGYFEETEDERIMVKVDEEGRILGFSVLNFSSLLLQLLKPVPVKEKAGVSEEERLDWAYSCVLSDPQYKFGTALKGDISSEVKRFIVKTYEIATGKRLL